MGDVCIENSSEIESSKKDEEIKAAHIETIKDEADFCAFVFSPSSTQPRLAYFKFAALDPGDVRVQILYFSISQADLALAQGQLRPIAREIVPGKEAVGKVIAKGAEVTQFRVGDVVGLALSTDYIAYQQFLHYYKFGSFATAIQLNQKLLIQIPKTLRLEKVAPVLSSGLSIYSAIKRLGIRKQHKVGLVGYGGMGQLAAQHLKLTGAKISIYSSSTSNPLKVKFAVDQGFKLQSSGQIKSISDYFDYFFVCNRTVSASDFNEYVRAIRRSGTVVLFSLPDQAQFKLEFSSLVGKGISIVGAIGGSRQQLKQLVSLVGKHKLYPEVLEFDFLKFKEALSYLNKSRPPQKLVVKVPEDWKRN